MIPKTASYNLVVDTINNGSFTLDRSPTGASLHVVVSDHGAGTELIDGETITGTGIPSLNVYEWNADNIRYLHKWLIDVCMFTRKLATKEVKITAYGSWRDKFDYKEPDDNSSFWRVKENPVTGELELWLK